MDDQHLAHYLTAMGIDHWVLRPNTPFANKNPRFRTPIHAAHCMPSASVENQDLTTAKALTPIQEIETPPISSIDSAQPGCQPDQYNWQSLHTAVTQCTSCQLSNTRAGYPALGVGNQTSDWLLVGATPGCASGYASGFNDNDQSKPFGGQAVQLLNNMLLAIGVDYHQVYMTTLLKCPLPPKYALTANEATRCLLYLQNQIQLLTPKIILVFGQAAAQHLLNVETPLQQLRQKQHNVQTCTVVITHDLMDVLQTPGLKRDVWDDLLLANRLIKTSTQ